ncbi:MAG: response regulator [Bdellovibrionales bacterium]
MKKNELKILIVEDDKTFSEALKQAIMKAGYTALVAHNPSDALELRKTNDFSILLIDCLLPKTTGVELALQLKGSSSVPTIVILMSAIFKDKNFMKDSCSKTGATHFLTKPFNVEDLIKILNTELASMVDDTFPPLVELLMKDNPTPGEKLMAIKLTTTSHGYDIPRIIGLLMSSVSENGLLELTDHENRTSTIYFEKNRLVRVESQDRQSYFGSLLAEKKLIPHDILEAALKNDNPDNKRVGERLVEANLLSPHYISLINTEQMAIRLSTLIQNINYGISFKEAPVSESEGHFDKPNLAAFFNDCVDAKLSLDWLKNYYLNWQDAQIKFTKLFEKSNPILTYGSISRVKNLISQIEGNTTLAQLLEAHKENISDVYNAVHLLTLHQMIYFERKAKTIDTTLQAARLTQLQNEYVTKDDFEVLGIPRRSKPIDIKKAYYELSKRYHPDKLPQNVEKNILDLTTYVYSKITAAYNRLIDDEQRANYLKELEVGQASKIMEAERHIEEGKSLLKVGQASKAYEKFKTASTLRPMNSELQLLLIWAQLAALNMTAPKSEETLVQASMALNKILPEDRHNAFYYFVKALYQKHVGDYPSALDNLNHAVSLQPDFIEAKRELNLLQITMKKTSTKSTSILNADLKDVVGMLFKRK